MISRVAESAFWLARYLERVETMARMMYVNINFVLDVNLEGVQSWYNQNDATGFIRLNGLRLRARALAQGGPKL